MDDVIADKPPISLYKYRKFDKNREGGAAYDWDKSIITGCTLWAGSPLEFNDPYDCFPITDFEGTSEEKRDWVEKVAPNFGMPVRQSVQMIENALANPEAIQQMSSWRDCLKSIGVLSLTEQANDMLMWAHYADSHRGYCLEFDAAMQPFSLAYRVHYAEERPKYRVFGRNREELILRTLLQKADFWKHEREWRLVKPVDWGAIDFPPEGLKSIILGVGIANGDEAALREIVAQRPSPVTFKRAKLNELAYRIEIVEA